MTGLHRQPAFEPRPRRVALRATALVLSATFAGWCGSAAMSLLAVRDDLATSRTHFLQAHSSFRAADTHQARSHLRASGIASQRAAGRLARWDLAPLDRLPLINANFAAVRTGITAAESIGAAATVLAERLDAAPRETGYLQWVGTLESSVARLARAASEAATEASAARTAMLLPPVRSAMAQLAADGSALSEHAETAAATLRALPPLLGSSEPRRYFFGAVNPAELRGHAGFLGAYSILSVNDGRLSFGPFRSAGDLPDLSADAVPAPNADFQARYVRYGGTGYWANVNMTPDFPSSATVILQLFEKVTGERVDGVILADPFALQALMVATGPVEIRGVGRVDASRAVEVVANEAFGAFPDPDERKRQLGVVAAEIFRRFLTETIVEAPREAASALGDVVPNGHLLIHSADPDVQRDLEIAGVAGKLLDPDGDYLSVVGVNASATKLDYYADRTVDYRVALEDSGRGTASATVQLTNNTPPEDLPQYVIGPNAPGFEARENATILNVYCAQDCAVHRFLHDGTEEPPRAETELGHPVFWSYERMRAGESRNVQYDWLLPRVWDTVAGEGRYRLTFQNQVTIRPSRVSLSIKIPDGMEVTSTTPAMDRDGETLTWTGETRADVSVEVRFRQPTESLWHRLRAWLGSLRGD